MDFRFTDEQLEMAEGARAILEGETPSERLRKLAEAPGGATDLWLQIADFGFLGVMAAEETGGLGFGSCEFILIAEAIGRVALPEPVIETACLIVPVLSALGALDLADVLAGRHRIALVHEENPFVNLADKADSLLFMTRAKIVLVSVEEAQCSPRESIDPLRRLFAVETNECAGVSLAEGDDAAALYDLTHARGAVFTSAELIGLADGMIAQATQYAKEREQFGAPIGGYQAIKHLLASAYVKVEFARPVVYRAAAVLDQESAMRDLAAAQAKRAAAEAAVFAAETAIQVHGAMGYTYEVDLHFWMKRAWALAGLWGDRPFYEKRLEDAVRSGGVALGPGATFEASLSEKHL